MLLAAAHVLRPVTGVALLVVEQTADTELLGGRAVPAGPVAGAGRFVAVDSVQPVTVLRGDGRVWGRGGRGWVSEGIGEMGVGGRQGGGT